MSEHIINVVGDFTQRKNLFQAKCTASGKVCSMVIEMRSSSNLASTTMVEKLGLPTIPHPHPYSLLWFRRGNSLLVTKQVLVTLSIGKNYKDEVLCDIIPMEICHLVLGTPWFYDRSVRYDEEKNIYGFKWDENKRINLIPFSSPPPSVSQDPPPPLPLPPPPMNRVIPHPPTPPPTSQVLPSSPPPPKPN